MAANELAIAKQALIQMGETLLPTSGAGTIAGIAETDWPSVVALQALYTQARQTTLRAFPWPWALKYASLGAVADDGTGEVWEYEWDNAYTYPADCLQVLRFITTYGPSDQNPPRFIIGYHGGAKVIFTDVAAADANIQYIEDVSTTTRFSVIFDMALAWRLTFELAMTLTVDPKMRDWALQNWQVALQHAQRVEGNEATPPKSFIVDGMFASSRHI